MNSFDTAKCTWQNPPKASKITPDRISIVTDPRTDFWQRTYYGFQNDNAHALTLPVSGDFSFTVHTSFDSKLQFDQCGIALYQDSDNWCKASIEYENADWQRLGSVVTNHGYSDWATRDIPAAVRRMSYRLSRRGMDFCFECAEDGVSFAQMRIFHLFEGGGEVNIGVYACSPGESSFTAEFTGLNLGPCLWKAHGEA